MIDPIIYATAFGLGFLGGAHCVGMCGGIMAALSFAIPDASKAKHFSILLAYNSGRIGSYVFIAVLAGSLLDVIGGGSGSMGHSLSVLRIIAGLLLVAMGLYLGSWWRGLTYLEKGGSYIWRFIQPLGKRLMPVKNVRQALLLGAIWGWLPCGLIYSALAYAVAQSASNEFVSLQAGLIMLAFGLGTLPAVLASGLFAEQIKQCLQSHATRSVFAVAVIFFGVWTIYGTLQHAEHSEHSEHSEHAEHGQHLEQVQPEKTQPEKAITDPHAHHH